MAESQHHPGGGCVAVDGGDGGHREGEELGHDPLIERGHHLAEAVEEAGAGGLGPIEVETVREELAVGGGDESGARAGRVPDLGEGSLDGPD